MIKTKVYLRADGNSTVGLGHVSRCLALAGMLEKDFDATLLIRSPSENIRSMAQAHGVTVGALPEGPWELEADALGLKLDHRAIVVLDGHSFDARYQQALIKKNIKVVCIDDHQTTDYYAHVVINHAEGLKLQMFTTAPYTQLFLGLKYAIIRQEFLDAAKSRQLRKNVSSVLVCFGGADPMNLTCRYIQRLLTISEIKIIAITGSAFQNKKEMSDLAENNANIELLENLSAAEMVAAFGRADLAIIPSSTIAIEACAVGVGIMSGYYVDNQENLYNGLLTNNMIFGCGNLNTMDNDFFLDRCRASMNIHEINAQIRNQTKLIDGNSDSRIRKIFDSLI